MVSASRSNAINLAALACIQASNALIPLLVFPVALTVLGAETYAELAITEAISILVLTAVLFSFEIDGVAKLSGADRSSDRARLADAVWSITAARLLLFLLASGIVLSGYALASGESPTLLALWLLVPLGHVFFGYWAWQGLEQNVAPAVLTLVSRLISLVGVLVLVRSPTDQALVPLLLGVPFAGAGLASLTWLCVRHRLAPALPRVSAVRTLIGNGRSIFGGNVAVMLYRETNVVLLGIAGVGAAPLSAYSLAEKTVKMVQAGSRPLAQLFFPKLLRAIHDNASPDREAARTIWRYTLPQLGAVAGLFVLLVPAWFIAPRLSTTVAELAALPGIGAMLAVMAPATLLGIANFTFGSAGLNQLGARGYFFRAILIAGITSAVACLLLAATIGAVGAAICFTAAEALLLVLVLRAYLRAPTAPPTSISPHQRHA